MPGAARILARQLADMRVMAAPVLAGRPEGFSERLDKVLAALPKGENDLIDPAAISGITQVDRGGADSLHNFRHPDRAGK